MHCSSTTLFWHCSIPYCPILSIKCFRGHKSPGSLCQGASLSLCLSFVVHFRSKALVHLVLFKDWNVASLVDGLSTKEQWPYSSFHEAHKSYAHFNMFFFAIQSFCEGSLVYASCKTSEACWRRQSCESSKLLQCFHKIVPSTN